MLSHSELEALISLLDDPDLEVHRHVFNKLTSLGHGVLPVLYQAWENDQNPDIQERLEEIIQDIQLKSTLSEFEQWSGNEEADILQGLLILSKIRYPDYNEYFISNELNRIRRAIWLAMGQYVSTIEQINIFNHVFFKDLGFRCLDEEMSNPAGYFMNHVIESRKGNAFSIAILYQCIAQSLRIPVYGIELPSVYCLAYLKNEKSEKELRQGISPSEVIFYINPMNNGLIFSRDEIRKYLESIQEEPLKKHFSPIGQYRSMTLLIQTLQKVYRKAGKTKEAEGLDQFLKFLI